MYLKLCLEECFQDDDKTTRLEQKKTRKKKNI